MQEADRSFILGEILTNVLLQLCSYNSARQEIVPLLNSLRYFSQNTETM